MKNNTKQTQSDPREAHHRGHALVDVIQMFLADATAGTWIARIRWPGAPRCPHCDHDDMQHSNAHKTMPGRCRGMSCRKWFCVKASTVMRSSKLSDQESAIAGHLDNTSLKSISSMSLRRDLEISQKLTWHRAHCIRKCWDDLSGEPMRGPVGVDEAHFGGRARNTHVKARRERISGRGTLDKTTVVTKYRATNQIAATVVADTDKATLHGFVPDHAGADAMVYTDEHRSYEGLPRHGTVLHPVADYVNGQAHVNDVEAFWTGLKRGYHGTFHHVSPEHLHRYVNEFAGRQSRRRMDTEVMIAASVRGFVGKHLPSVALIGAPEPAAAGIPAGHLSLP